MINTQYINLNMIPSGVMPVMYCSQYDVGRPLGIVVYNGSEAVDLDTYTCTIEATRTDGTAITAAVTTADNIGVFTTTATMTNQADRYLVKLVLFDSNSRRVASLAFVMVVTERTMDENAESIEEDRSLYQQYTMTVQTIIAEIRSNLNAEIARSTSADTSLQSALSAETSARQSAVQTLTNGISSEASARQSADNTLQSNINAEASARQSADNVLQGQIDAFVQLPSGSTTGDAELINIRVGADGVTYPSAGGAVRANDTSLSKELKNAAQITFEDLGYLALSYPMVIGSTNLWSSTNGGSHALINVNPGDTVTIKSNPSVLSIYAVLRGYSTPEHMKSPLFSTVEGFTTRQTLSANDSIIFTAPGDAAFVYITTELSGTIFTPTSITINGHDAFIGTRKLLNDSIADVRRVMSEKYDGVFGTTENAFSYDGMVEGTVNNNGEIVSASGFETTSYLPVEPTKHYILYTQENGVFSASRFAFYSTQDVSGFISLKDKEGDYNFDFTAPEGCHFVRVVSPMTSSATGLPFPDGAMLTNDILTLFSDHVLFKGSTKNDDEIKKLQIYELGLNGLAESLSMPYAINANNNWGTDANNRHLMIPINPGDVIELKANQTAVYALLKSESFAYGASPDYVYLYGYRTSEIGEPIYEVVTDGQGNPVSDGRHVLVAYSTATIVAVPESAFLYVTYKIIQNNTEIITLPSITINGKSVYDTQNDGEEYTTILFDDFNTLDRNTWTFYTESPPEHGEYKSRFYTTDNNVWCEQSMLVMKVARTSESGHGYDAEGNPIAYLAPYIGTGNTFAIPAGRISARIKASNPISKNFFSWAFWTFGQNAEWGYAHESDIAEVIQGIYDEDVVSRDGTLIPAGSINSTLGCHIHTKDENGENREHTRFYEIKIALLNGGTYAQDQQFYVTQDIDTSDWHEYSVEWNEDTIRMFVDGTPTYQVNANDINAVDENGNIGYFHPQDVRFNIKCKLDTAMDEGYLYVDWVKVENLDKTPCTSIYHDDITMNVGESKYIQPTFNTGCSNQAFEMTVDDTDIISVDVYNNDTSAMVVHRINAISSGTATVSIRAANGKTVNTFTVTVV